MIMPLTDVEIVITDQTRPLTQRGFGLPLIFGTTKAHPYTEYTSLSAVAEDFQPTDPEYLAAQAIFRQSPNPGRVALYWVERTTPGDLTTSLNVLVQQHNEWYWLVFVPRQHEDTDLEDLAGWVAAAGKFAVFTNEAGMMAAQIVAQAQAIN